LSPFFKIRPESLDDILNGPPMKNTRISMAQNHPFEACHRCDDFIWENFQLYKIIKQKERNRPTRRLTDSAA